MRFLNFGVFFFLAGVLVLGFSDVSFSAGDSSECVITIKSVQLKKDSGEWITVIEPDHQVDLAKQEPRVSFFNNGQRVPVGSYSNFKVIFYNKGSDQEIQIYGNKNFSEPLKAKAKSFISVWFDLNLCDKVEQATVVVDDQKIVVPNQGIGMSY